MGVLTKWPRGLPTGGLTCTYMQRCYRHSFVNTRLRFVSRPARVDKTLVWYARIVRIFKVFCQQNMRLLTKF